jgi:hypothetical protein
MPSQVVKMDLHKPIAPQWQHILLTSSLASPVHSCHLFHNMPSPSSSSGDQLPLESPTTIDKNLVLLGGSTVTYHDIR